MNRTGTHNEPEHLFAFAKVLRTVLTDEDIKALRQRNEERCRQAIAELGTRWVGWVVKQ